MQVLGQGGQRRRGDIGIELQQQHGDRLRMFVGEDFADDLGIEPAQQAQRGQARFLGFGRDLAHEVVGLHLAHRPVEELADAVDPAVTGNAAVLGRTRETGDGIDDGLRFDFADPAHRARQLAQFVGRKLAEDLRGILFGEQHDHDGRLVGAAEQLGCGRGHVDAPCRASSASRRRSASTASSGFSRAIR